MASQLETIERRYRALAAELTEVGFIAPEASWPERPPAASAAAAARPTPPRRHGPYYQWSRAMAGKTASRGFTAEANLYRQWIANRRRLEGIVTEMGTLSAVAGEILLRRAAIGHPDTTGQAQR